MVLTITLILSTLILFVTYLKLLRISKRDTVLYAMCDYRRELMALIRSERFNSENVSIEDYKNVKKALNVVNHMIKIYSESYPSSFHSRNFVNFIRTFIKAAFAENSELQKSKSISKNEEIKYLQKKLVKLIAWAIYYSTPRILKISVFTSLTIALLSIIVSIIKNNFVNKIINLNIKEWIWVRDFLPWIKATGKGNISQNISI